MNLKVRHYIVVFSVLAMLSACSSFESKDEKLRAKQTEELISTAKANLTGGDYSTAVEQFDILEARYPQGAIAEEAKLSKIYAYYQNRNPEKALAEANAFLKAYPNHPYLDYVLYMKGIVDFDRALSIVDKFLPPDRSRIDPAQLRRSLESFQSVVDLYPESQYATDARKRVVYLRNMLAQSEINIAEYYFRRKAFVAVANRAQYVLDNYERTPAVADALYLQVRAYRELKLDDLAANRLDIFRKNFPQDERLSTL